jgi:uncharacterized membrane protein YbhN (UPF0104 family)
MSEVARTIVRRLRSLSWNVIGSALSAIIVIAAAAVLLQLLSDVDLTRMIAALKAKPLGSVLLATGFAACGLIGLSAYDWFALRTIGKDGVPYRVALFGSFTAYTIGHNLGATVLTAGAIRWRIYSRWGLTLGDIAKVAFITGLTFWLGNAFLLGSSMAYAPAAASAIDRLPESLNRIIGLTGLAIIATYLVWLLPRPRNVRLAGLRINLPSAPMTVVQIGIGTFDLLCGSAAMYCLFPEVPGIDPINLLVIFVAALLLGFLSHAPGSLGVIEAGMLMGLPQFQKEELLASLLMFRVLYFMLPLSLAVALLGLRELLLRREDPRC